MILTIFILALIGSVFGYYTFYFWNSQTTPPTMLTAITIITAWDMLPWLGITLCSVFGVVWIVSILLAIFVDD